MALQTRAIFECNSIWKLTITVSPIILIASTIKNNLILVVEYFILFLKPHTLCLLVLFVHNETALHHWEIEICACFTVLKSQCVGSMP